MNQKFSQDATRHLTWTVLEERIREGIPFVFRIPAPKVAATAVAVDIVSSADGAELVMRIPIYNLDEKLPLSTRDIEIAQVQDDAGQAIIVKSSVQRLYQELYNFFISVTDKIQLDGETPTEAIRATLEVWKDILRPIDALSDNAQTGLRGELLFLRILATMYGDRALEAWTGPNMQPHDFRFGNSEVEVKTTRGTTHSHIINGLTQLQPSPGHKLFIFSLRLTTAGLADGSTLLEEIDKTRSMFSSRHVRLFDIIISDSYHIDNKRTGLYSEKLKIASVGRLIPVDEKCPRLTPSLLDHLPLRALISDVQYRVNLDHLGFAEGTKDFSDSLYF